MIIYNSTEAFELIQRFHKPLLVEPYSIKYVPFGLVKLYTFYNHIKPAYRFGKHKFEKTKYDVIFISTGEFSYYHKELIGVVNFYKREYPGVPIICGGVYAITDKNLREELDALGCTVIACNISQLDSLRHFDYSLFEWNPWEFIFTTRGCRMKCEFCYVKQIEPEPIVVENWVSQLLNSTRPYIMIHDNNIISYGEEHFKNVTDALIEIKKPVMFDNGFDCRFWNKNISSDLEKISHLLSYSSVRFAFDSMNQDGKIQKALYDVGRYYPIKDILVYVLVNYTAPFEECLYRAKEVAKTGAYPFIQYYTPLDWKDKPELYKGPTWTEDYLVMQAFFNNKKYRTTTFEKFLDEYYRTK
jgi:hypothetical protein